MLKPTVRRLLERLGYRIVSTRSLPADMSQEELAIYDLVRPYTMTTVERILALVRATRYVIEAGIPGHFVECGVWKGGSTMAVARALQGMGVTDRQLFMFDTFTGMTSPGNEDRDANGRLASEVLDQRGAADEIWARASLDTVRSAMDLTGYPLDNVQMIPGRVETTLPDRAPDAIALLRLDTDWYQSTKHELVHLFPRLNRHGVLIIDDYGHWEGARRAVDEYLQETHTRIFLSRIDYTGRIAIKT